MQYGIMQRVDIIACCHIYVTVLSIGCVVTTHYGVVLVVPPLDCAYTLDTSYSIADVAEFVKGINNENSLTSQNLRIDIVNP